MIWLVVGIVAVVALIIILAVVRASRARRSEKLRSRFGSEYDLRVQETGDRRAGEAQLRDVAKRREELEVRPLSSGARERYSVRWREVQANFVDQPDRAVTEADALVADVMRERGYPVEDFDERVDMVAVDHPTVVENYRAGHAVFARNAQRMASTDDLRQALIHYRSLFEELLEETSSSH